MRTLSKVCILIYQLGPVIIVPFLAYYFDNWYLLFGILFSWAGSFSVFNAKAFVGLFLIVSIVTWIRAGFDIHQYITFFFFCSLFGYTFTTMAESYHQETTKGTLENDFERTKFLLDNPNYLEEKMMKWREQNPDKQMTYDIIDALAKGKINL